MSAPHIPPPVAAGAGKPNATNEPFRRLPIKGYGGMTGVGGASHATADGALQARAARLQQAYRLPEALRLRAQRTFGARDHGRPTTLAPPSFDWTVTRTDPPLPAGARAIHNL